MGGTGMFPRDSSTAAFQIPADLCSVPDRSPFDEEAVAALALGLFLGCRGSTGYLDVGTACARVDLHHAYCKAGEEKAQSLTLAVLTDEAALKAVGFIEQKDRKAHV